MAKKTGLSPVFWEKMIAMTPQDLQSTLDDGLEIDSVWILDQAICAAQNVHQTSEKGAILSAFCHAHHSKAAQQNLYQSIEAAITGLSAVSDDDDALENACNDIVKIFEQMAVFNREKSMSMAVASKAQLGAFHPLCGALTTFILNKLDDDDYDMYKHVSQNAAALTPEGRDDFITKLETLSATHGFGIITMLENFCIECAELHDDPSLTRAASLLQHLSENPPITALISQKSEPKKYDVDGDVITLHPRPDPQ